MQKIRKIIDFVLNRGILAWMAVAFVWYMIVSTLHRVISCDEGYYLMGFLVGQNVDGQATNFHYITRALCRPFADDNIMVFRHVRLAWTVFALIVFALSSFEWLSRRKGLPISRWAYYPMMALAGAMSFTFAAPTLSYDSIETIIALFVASLLFVQLTSRRENVKLLCAFGIGFLLWFSFTNSPPAGCGLAVLFAGIFFVNADENKWKSLLFAFLGMVSALVVHHLIVQDLRVWFSDISKILVSTFTEKSGTGHDTESLIPGLLRTIGSLFVVLVPVVVLSTLFFRKVRLPEWLLWSVTLALCVYLVVFRKEYELRGMLFMLPVALMLGKKLSQPDVNFGEYLISKDFWTAFALVAIPLAGVFGTNQGITNKAVIFTPFWMMSYFLLASRVEERQAVRLHVVFTVMLLGGYVYLGSFQRYHCYYTPRSSRCEIIGASRPQRVLVSEYQQQYYKDVFDSLRFAGCEAGDLYMAFGENQMAVYLAGGFISGRLVYHDVQYKTFDAEAPKAFILFRIEEDGVIARFRKTTWGFPETYRRMEMRQMSQNMSDEYRTVIYVKNN